MTWMHALKRRSSLRVKRDQQQPEFQCLRAQQHAKQANQRRHSVSECAAAFMNLATANLAAMNAAQECIKTAKPTQASPAPFQVFSGLFEASEEARDKKTNKRRRFACGLGVSTTASSSNLDKSASGSSVKSPQQKLCLQQQKSPQKVLEPVFLYSNCSGNRELPVIRSRYTARDVKVFIGKKFLLNHFETSKVVLHTGVQPKLCITFTATKHTEKHSTNSEPSKTIALPLDTKCEIKHRNQVKLSAQSLAFHVYLKFTMVADALIWLKLIQEALRLASFLGQIKPKHFTNTNCDSRRTTGSFLAGKPNVMLYEHVTSKKQLVIKVLPHQRVDSSREVTALKRLFMKTQGIVDQYAVFETPYDVRVIMPLFEGKTLLEMVSAKRKLNEQQAKQLMRRICQQLDIMHAAGVVHCDLKLENFLVSYSSTTTGPTEGNNVDALLDAHEVNVQIIDFGGAFLLEANGRTPSKQKSQQQPQPEVLIGTPGYVSPGRLRGANPTPQSDVFAMGIILYQMITGCHPFPTNRAARLPLDVTKSLDLVKIQVQLASFGISLGVQELIVSMLEPDADKRISLADIMTHVWMQ